jgi:hypothetical protein
MKKFVVAATVAALATASSASFAAGYATTFTGLTGDFVISDFGTNTAGPTIPDADKKFKVTLSNVDGKVSIQVPPAGNYNIYALAGSSSLIDYDGVPGADLGAVYPSTTKVGSGPVSVTNTSSSLVEFDFNGVGTTSLKLDGVSQAIPYSTGSITVSGAGATALFGSLLGLGSFLSGPVSGTVDILYTVSQDRIDITIDEANLIGGKFENALLTLDNMPAGFIPGKGAGNRDAIIDGTFASNGVIYAVSEPASMALLGLGMAGLAAVRRRKAA